MASYNLVTWEMTAERKEMEASSALTFDMTSFQIGPSTLEISEVGGEFSLNDHPVIDVTSIEIGASGLSISEAGGGLSIGSPKLVDVALPTESNDMSNKDYVDSVGEGLDFKGPCKALSDSNLNVTASGSGEGKLLTSVSNELLVIDEVGEWFDMDNDGGVNDPYPETGTPASRVLINGQTDPANNGIYAVKNKGDDDPAGAQYVLVRASDFDTNQNVTSGSFTFITDGPEYCDSGWVLSTDDVDVDVNALNFVAFSNIADLVGGDGIEITTAELANGTDNISSGVTSHVVTLSPALSSSQYKVNASIVNTTDPSPMYIYPIVTAKTNSSFTISWNQPTDTANYQVDYALTSGQNVIAVDLATNSGLEFFAEQLRVDLAAAGTGTGGLVLTGNEIEVIAGPGTFLASSGLIVNSRTDADSAPYANAMETTANGLRIRVDAASIEGSLQGGAGAEDLRVKDAGIGANHLNTSVAGDGLSGGGGAALAVNAGAGLEIVSDNLQITWSESFTNDDASTVTAGQIVYMKSNGAVELATPSVATDENSLYVVRDSSIASAASGEMVCRRGAILFGFSGMTPGKRQYVHVSTPGGLQESLSGYTAGNYVYCMGRAKSATELIYNPKFEFVY